MRFLVIVSALAVVACQGIGESIERSDVSGIHYLAEMDGSAVPAKVVHDGVTLQVRSGTFIISEDGTCFSRTRFRPPAGEEIIREVRAKYRIEGSRLIMQWEGAGGTEGTVDGDTFVMDNEGMIFEYSRSG